MVSDGRSQLQEESLAWASRRVGGAPGTSERSRPHKGPAPEWTQHSRLRGEACSQASEQQPCLMNTGFALNKSPLILRAASKEVPPSPATHSTHVFLETSEGSLPAAGTDSSRGRLAEGRTGPHCEHPTGGRGVNRRPECVQGGQAGAQNCPLSPQSPGQVCGQEETGLYYGRPGTA